MFKHGNYFNLRSITMKTVCLILILFSSYLLMSIDYASDGDTIIVQSGIYYENINFLGKGLIIGSQYLFTENEDYIHNTIIDGNQEGSVVVLTSEESHESKLIGLTIRNGSGEIVLGGSIDSTVGGGIYIEDSSPILKDLIIEDNRSSYAGGLFFRNSNAYIENVTIRNNTAHSYGGGIMIYNSSSFNSDLSFSEINRCNVYNNLAGVYNDIYLTNNFNGFMNIFIDTLSVLEYDNHFVSPNTNLNVEVLNGKFNYINDNLYVDPNGSDENDGLTPETPLKRINYALAKIYSDSLNPKTIYLSSGIYSPSENQQSFRLNCKDYVSIVGAGADLTILDAENKSGLAFLNDDMDVQISGIAMFNGYSFSAAGINSLRSTISLNNVIIRDCIGDNSGGISAQGGLIVGKNIEISNTMGDSSLRIGKYFETDMSCDFRNLKIINNGPLIDQDIRGGAIVINLCIDAIFINTLVSNNEIYDPDWALTNFCINSTTNTYLINSTISENNSNYGGGIGFTGPGDLHLINSIVYGNNPYEFVLNRSDEQGFVNYSYSDIDDQNDFLYVASTEQYAPELNWNEGVIRENPHFIEGEEDDPQSYQLSNISPCINTGTLDLPEGIELPEYDLLGNPRIYGDNIDMGCYEWQGTDASEDVINGKFNLINYPNPFNPETIIEFALVIDTDVILSIYNVKGQLVRTLINTHIEKGVHQVIWDGTDDNNNSVSSGIYYCKIESGSNVAVKKMVVVK